MTTTDANCTQDPFYRKRGTVTSIKFEIWKLYVEMKLRWRWTQHWVETHYFTVDRNWLLRVVLGSRHFTPDDSGRKQVLWILKLFRLMNFIYTNINRKNWKNHCTTRTGLLRSVLPERDASWRPSANSRTIIAHLPNGSKCALQLLLRDALWFDGRNRDIFCVYCSALPGSTNRQPVKIWQVHRLA